MRGRRASASTPPGSRFGRKPVDSACESGSFFLRASVAAAVRKFFGFGPLRMSIADRHGRLRCMNDAALSCRRARTVAAELLFQVCEKAERGTPRESQRDGDRPVVACGGG